MVLLFDMDGTILNTLDDICDSGNTALCWKNKGYTIATMYYKQGASVTPDIWWKEKEDKWIVFPFEKQI